MSSATRGVGTTASSATSRGMAEFAQNHPLGATWSYCNSGYVLAGRLVEYVTGMTWDAALRERLARPLGLTRTVTLPEDALLHRTAVGHVGEPEDDPVPATSWALSRSMGPAGMVTASVEDVLSFARMHLTGGLAADRTRVLSAAAVEAMAAKEADLPDTYTLGDSWGLGWIRFGWDGERLLGHDGNTIGQSAFLRLLPSHGLAVALLTNGGNTKDLFHDLYREIFDEAAGVEKPASLEPRRVAAGRRAGGVRRPLRALGDDDRGSRRGGWAEPARNDDRAARRRPPRARARVPPRPRRARSLRAAPARGYDLDGCDVLLARGRQPVRPLRRPRQPVV